MGVAGLLLLSGCGAPGYTGPTGTVTLQFTPEYTRFSNLAATERLPERME